MTPVDGHREVMRTGGSGGGADDDSDGGDEKLQ